MKLKTILKNGAFDRTGSVGAYFGNCEHDSAVAHALLQAMEQWGIDEFGVVDALKSRAAEIMAGWGYPAPKSLEESKA